MDYLRNILSDGTRFDPHYLPSMNSDHMPMTICAIKGLGGSERTIQEFRDDYSGILRELPKEDILLDWRAGIGLGEQYAALLHYFKEQIVENGIESTVKEYLPEFLGGIATGAFHPIIRLGYAIDFGSEDETAAGLAYLISSHRDTPIDASVQIDIREAMMNQVEKGARTFRSSRFGQSIAELLEDDAYPVGSSATLKDCAEVAFDVYLGTRNFFALHLVTATQAVRVCASIIGEKQVLAPLTGSLLAAHLVLGSPGFKDPLKVPERLDREHAYKYSWACLSEHRFYGGKHYIDEIKTFRNQGLIPDWCAEKEIG
jgi:hypothetical protein